MIKYYYRSVRQEKVKKLKEPKKGALINVYNITNSDINKLVELGFDFLILEDAKDFYEVPRFEYVDGINYLFTRYPTDDPSIQESATAMILFAISEEYILVVTHEEPAFFKELLVNPNVYTTQKVKFLLLALSEIIKDYELSLKEIRKTLRKYLVNIGEVSDNDLRYLVGIEAILNDYISSAMPTKDAFSQMILRKKTLTLHQNDIDILEDFIQDFDQIITTAKNIAKTASNSRSLYEVVLSQKLNKIMKTLTALTIVLTVPTIMTGLFGMNTWLPFTNGPAGFVYIIILTVVLSSLVTIWLIKNDWF